MMDVTAKDIVDWAISGAGAIVLMYASHVLKRHRDVEKDEKERLEELEGQSASHRANHSYMQLQHSHLETQVVGLDKKLDKSIDDLWRENRRQEDSWKRKEIDVRLAKLEVYARMPRHVAHVENEPEEDTPVE